MWFGEPHPFPERGSPTILSASGQKRYKGWSCRRRTATRCVMTQKSAALFNSGNLMDTEIRYVCILWQQIKLERCPRTSLINMGEWRQRHHSFLTSAPDVGKQPSSRSFQINPLTPNDLYISRTTQLTSKRCILYIYSTNIGTDYFKHDLD
jgi:hypothetical protein